MVANDENHFVTRINYLEMVLDWTAMGFKFGDTAKGYYSKNKYKIQIREEYQEFVEKILDIMDRATPRTAN